jgi:alanyl-tRNA synthetase
MNSKELRKTFLEFFEKRGHKITKSASLTPSDDKTVLFNVAGMQQFKKY